MNFIYYNYISLIIFLFLFLLFLFLFEELGHLKLIFVVIFPFVFELLFFLLGFLFLFVHSFELAGQIPKVKTLAEGATSWPLSECTTQSLHLICNIHGTLWNCLFASIHILVIVLKIILFAAGFSRADTDLVITHRSFLDQMLIQFHGELLIVHSAIVTL